MYMLSKKKLSDPSPTVFILGNTKTYISTLNNSNIPSNNETAVNNSLGFETALQIPDVDLNDS